MAASDAAGAAITATPQITGVVGSVQTANGQTVVQIGGSTAPVTSITNISAS